MFCVVFQLVNNMTMAVDVYSKTEDVKRFRAIQHLAGTQEFTKLATINPRDSFCPPLYVAYHCPLYLKPSDLEWVCLSFLSYHCPLYLKPSDLELVSPSLLSYHCPLYLKPLDLRLVYVSLLSQLLPPEAFSVIAVLRGFLFHNRSQRLSFSPLSSEAFSLTTSLRCFLCYNCP